MNRIPPSDNKHCNKVRDIPFHIAYFNTTFREWQCVLFHGTPCGKLIAQTLETAKRDAKDLLKHHFISDITIFTKNGYVNIKDL